MAGQRGGRGPGTGKENNSHHSEMKREINGGKAGSKVALIILRMPSNPSLDKSLSPNILISKMGSYYLISCED